jgi:hypothetical protein
LSFDLVPLLVEIFPYIIGIEERERTDSGTKSKAIEVSFEQAQPLLRFDCPDSIYIDCRKASARDRLLWPSFLSRYVFS